MKRIYEYLRIREIVLCGLSVLFLFVALPSAVFAQGAAGKPYTQYCPDPTQIFTGVALDENGKPRIELLVESSFEQRMQIERKLGSLPVTPIYDLVIRVVPTINEYCLPQYDEAGKLISKVDPPGTLPFTVYFTLGNEILLGGTATRYASQKTEKGEPYYEWEKTGWPNGIFVSDKLERVIKAVQENDPTLRIGVLVDRSHNDAERVEKPISFELCVPLSGGTPHTIVYMRSKSSKLEIPQLVVGIAEAVRLYGFEEIEPLKTYSLRGSEGSYFAHFADLSLHDDTGWATVFKTFFVFANKEPQKISACGKNASQYFFPTARIPKNGGYAPYGGGVAFISPGLPGDGWIHEFAHSFSGLEDNYRTGFDITLYYANCAPPGREPHWGSVARSRAFGGDGFYYGDKVKGCSVSGQYRPSGDSLMCGGKGCIKGNSYSESPSAFDVVSCGYLLTAIEHDTEYLRSFPKSELIANWERCKKMKGIIQPAISTGDEIDQRSDIPRSTSRLLAAVFPTLAQTRPDSGETVNLDFNSPYISVETFADDGSISAEIFERVGGDKGEQTEWRKVKATESPTESSLTRDGASGGGLNWRTKNGGRVMELFDEAGHVYQTIPLPAEKKVALPDEDDLIAELYRKVGDLDGAVNPRIQGVAVPNAAAGAPLRITWQSTAVPNVKLELLHYRRDEAERVITESAENTDAYDWTVPDDLDDDVYRIRVSAASNPAVKAISDKFDIEKEKKPGLLARTANFVRETVSKVVSKAVRKSAPPVPAEESCGALSSGMLSPALSVLGFYHDRMCRLRQSVAAALDAWEQKVNEPRGGKGGEALKGDRALEAPLYLLRKMKKSLEPEDRGGLKEPAGLNRFFARLRSLRDFSDPLFDDIFRRAEEFQGFSYLFPPESGKPLLIFVPGANGEAGWRGATQLLTAASENYNILGYTYDATVPAGEMVRRLRSHIEQRKLHERESVIVMMSLGNTLVHSAIAKDLDSQLPLFSKSRVVSVGFLPGGSSKFLGKPDAVPALAKKIFPPYASIFEMMDPRNPEQESLAANIERIIGATRGITYIQASEDDHIDFKSSASPYAHNRDKIFSTMRNTLRSVAPPHLYQKGNNHVNLLYAPEVERAVNGLAPLLKSSPRSTAPSFLSVSELFSSAHRLTAAAPLSRGGTAGMLDIISSLIGSPQNECSVLEEVLEDGEAVSSSDEYALLLGSVRDYATLSELPCASGIGETPAAQESIGSPNLSATTPTISGSSAGVENRLYAGEMSFVVNIRRTGDATLPTFKNTLQYASGDGPLTDWFSFDVPTFKAGHTAEFTYKWKGGEGIWGLRLCVDSGNAVPESDETDNCTAVERIEVIASPDAPSAIGAASVEGGQPRLTLAAPAWSGTHAGEGKLRAGKMTLSATVTNSGNADSLSIRGVWQYSLGTGSFVDWIRIEFPALAPGAASNSSYSWEGGKGLWRARFCIFDDAEGRSRSRSCSGAAAAEIVE